MQNLVNCKKKLTKNSTRIWWPLSFVIGCMLGYFHKITWLYEYPWVDTSSELCFDQATLHTWLPVSMHCIAWPVIVFQNRSVRSAVPPPDTSTPWWCGDHASALTAALCSVYVWTGSSLRKLQTNNWLSFPPDAKYSLFGDHLSPHTYKHVSKQSALIIKVPQKLGLWKYCKF